MDVAGIENKLQALAIHAGIGRTAADQTAQQVAQLQQEFNTFRTQLQRSHRRILQLQDQNEAMRGQLRENGIDAMEVEEGEVTDEDTAPQAPMHLDAATATNVAHSSQALPAYEQLAHHCERCGQLSDEEIAAAHAAQAEAGEDTRMPVCTFCWAMSTRCDRGARCQTCMDEDRVCVRKRCEGGVRCSRQNCPRLHPSQWDATDPGWTVEEGRMPEQGIKPEEIDRP